jgi:hypothetical protein
MTEKKDIGGNAPATAIVAGLFVNRYEFGLVV